MNYIVSITSQGQLTIPKAVREKLGLKKGTKAVLKQKDGALLVEPKKDFWSLGGSLKSKVKLSNKDLKKARADFEKKWAEND